MPHLASAIEKLKPRYDVVVIGSGYGGAVAASRLARAGRSVCVLERGEEWQPGEYPDTMAEGFREIQVDLPERRIGSRTGLYDFRVNRDISVFQGCGLGGTSLVNANVALAPEPRVFQHTAWPEALRLEPPERLQSAMQRALEMLRPTPLPESEPVPLKLKALERSAQHLGRAFYRPPITVNFKNGINHVGVEQQACNHCGNCISGCNHGAKNTLIMNYLPDAVNHGAEIFTRAAVRRVERQAGRWVVQFEVLDPGRERFGGHTLFVAAEVVIVAAGSLGSTEILLRSREAGLPMSDRIGQNFTGNGDFLAFGYNTAHEINGVGTPTPAPGDAPGPCITGIVDMRGEAELDRGMVIEEGVIPSALSALLPAALAAAAGAVGTQARLGSSDFTAERMRELNALFMGPQRGAMRNTQTFLVMTHDDARGRIHLEADRARISWPGVGEQSIFHEVNERLRQSTVALNGVYLKNPMWSRFGNHGLVTVHPLGGCAMGDTAENGVVNHKGQLFAGESGDAVHDGLYVTDGAVIPRAVGVNPLLTITSLAERTCAILAEERGWTLPYDLPSRPRHAALPVERRIGLRFTEAMRGHMAPVADTAEWPAADAPGASPLEFTVTVSSDDLTGMLASANRAARLFGSVVAPALSARPLAVTGGHFQFLSAAEDQVNTRVMRYGMHMVTEDGRSFFLDGCKRLHSDNERFDAWTDATTLFATVHEGEDASGPIVGRGVLRSRPADLAQQLATVRIINARSLRERLRAGAEFGRFFAGSLYDTYGGVFSRPSAFNPEAPPRKKRPLRAPAPEVHTVHTDDGVELRLTRYPGPRGTPVLLVHDLGVSSFLFAMDTVETTLVEYLAADGRDVWLLDHRASSVLESATTAFDAGDVAHRDLPAALAHIRGVTGAVGVDVLGHGFGAIALIMGLTAGLEGVRSAICSQVGLHMQVPRTSRLKAGMRLPELLRSMGMSTVAGAQARPGWQGRLFESALRFMPSDAADWCSSPVCNRVAFLYGPQYEHGQLNAATHEALHELFGIAGIRAFEHLGVMVRKGHIVTLAGDDRYVPAADRLTLPLSFMHGGSNRCVLPVSTQLSYEFVAQRAGPDRVRRVEVPGYGNMDFLIGRNAATDVFPHILEHLRWAEQLLPGPVPVAFTASVTAS